MEFALAYTSLGNNDKIIYILSNLKSTKTIKLYIFRWLEKLSLKLKYVIYIYIYIYIVSTGWIRAQDPYGWFQWYCRFYMGRRTEDDTRQIKRWKSFDGRWKSNLVNQIKRKKTSFDDFSVSPTIRQSLLHWGIEITKKDIGTLNGNHNVNKRLIDLVPLQ